MFFIEGKKLLSAVPLFDSKSTETLPFIQTFFEISSMFKRRLDLGQEYLHEACLERKCRADDVSAGNGP